MTATCPLIAMPTSPAAVSIPRDDLTSALAEPPLAPRVGTYLAYGIGMTGNQILRDVPTALLLFYMTNAMLIPAGYAGMAILLPKIWVVLADPLVGSLSDRTRTRWGSRKPFLVAGSLLATLTFIALFSTPMPASPIIAAILVGLLYALMATGYSVYSVPYLTMAAEIGDNQAERTAALAYKQVFCLVGVVAGLALAPWLITSFGGGRSAYARMSVVLGAVMLVTTMATALFVPTRHTQEPAQIAPARLFRRMMETFAHRPFRIVFIASTMQLLSFGISQAGGLYFLIYVMRLPMTTLGFTVMGSVVGSALSQIVWVRLSARYGVIPVYRAATLFAALCAAAVLLVPIGNAPAYVIVGTIGGAATGGFTLMSFAALIEAIAADGRDSNRKALFSAAYSAMEKTMLALGGFVIAIALAAAHFVAGAPAGAQPASVTQHLLYVFVGGQVVLKLTSLWVLCRSGAHRGVLAEQAQPG